MKKNHHQIDHLETREREDTKTGNSLTNPPLPYFILEGSKKKERKKEKRNRRKERKKIEREGKKERKKKKKKEGNLDRASAHNLGA